MDNLVVFYRDTFRQQEDLHELWWVKEIPPRKHSLRINDPMRGNFLSYFATVFKCVTDHSS